MIEIRGVNKSFPARKGRVPVDALRSIDLTIANGEFVTILGPSGCGKTTLLRQVAGLETWDAGGVWVKGEPVTRPSPDRAMVFQQFALLPWATVLTNVAIGLEIRGEPRGMRQKIAGELIGLVGLSGFEDNFPGELSGGMQQRVGLARALAVDPSVLLMDEPFGALDEQTRRLLQEELLRLWEHDPKTVMFVTHSIHEAVLLGDRVVLMSARPGRVRELIDVELPRPRHKHLEEIATSAAFVELVERLWIMLRDMQPSNDAD